MKRYTSLAVATFFIFSSISMPSFAAERSAMLSVGDHDEQVINLQKSLYEQGYLQFPATGFFGADTQNAVIQFQKDHNLSEDGKVGQDTFNAIISNIPFAENKTTGMAEGIKGSDVNAENSLIVSDKLIGETIKKAPAISTINNKKEETVAQKTIVLLPGDKGEEIIKMQTRLKELQYYDYSNITGYYGPVTEDAIKKFQRSNGINQDGILGIETAKVLYSDEAKPYMMNIGDSGEDIRSMQERLRELGYMKEEATGYYGDVTENAIKAFQEANKLSIDGKVGQQTRNILFADNAKPIFDKNNLSLTEKTQPSSKDTDENSLRPNAKETADSQKVSNTTKSPLPSETPTLKPSATSKTDLSNDTDKKPSAKPSLEPTATPIATTTLTPASKSSETPNTEQLSKPSAVPSVKPSSEPSSKPSAEQNNSSSAPTNTDNASIEETTNVQKTEVSKETDTNDKIKDEDLKPEQTQTESEISKDTEKKEEEKIPNGAPSVEKLLSIAESQKGKTYKLASNGPDSFDCSGFIYYSLKNCGVTVSRLSSASYAVLSTWETIGDINSLKPGDLVFFKSDNNDVISHSGIYMGDGQFIHSAPSLNGVGISSISSGYYQRNFVTAKRVF